MRCRQMSIGSAGVCAIAVAIIALAAGLLAAGADGGVSKELRVIASCTIAGSWTQTTETVGSTIWTITADGNAKETGLGYASGRATLAGSALKITWTTTNGWAGVYRWTLGPRCSGNGTLTFSKGPRSGESASSKVTGPPPKATSPSKPTASSARSTKRLQQDLRELGFFSGPLDGRTSAKLTQAIKDFQRNVGISSDGRCETRCNRALNQALELDDPSVADGSPPRSPASVKELQEDLRKLGFYNGALDGRTSPTLRLAITDFQRNAGLKADGTCERACQLAIVRALMRS